MKRIIKILFICLVVLFVSTVSAKIVYVSYTDEVSLTTQYNTGRYWRDNCGAASLYMALEYMEYNLGSVEDIRRGIKNQSGWLYTNELEDYLDDNEVDYDVVEIEYEEDIIKAIDKGILIMCLDMSKVSGKDYSGITGHFIAVVGYVYRDEEYLLEVYDPMSRKTKYYELNEVFLSASEWWGYFFLFEKNDGNEV